MARLSRAALLAECFQDVRELLLGSTRARISFTTMLAVFAFMLYVHLGKPPHRRPVHASLTTVRSPPSSELWSSLPRQQVQLSPTYEVLEGLEAVWQKPERPRGLLLTAHGCNHGGVDFFPAHPHSCPLCTGLPLELQITRQAVARGYAVLAVSSGARYPDHRCWTEQDIPLVKALLEAWRQREGMQALPVFAVGASSGGAFVLQLALAGAPLAGVCSQIMALPLHLLRPHLPLAAAKSSDSSNSSSSRGGSSGQGPAVGGEGGRQAVFPPTMFVHMPRDLDTAQLVVQNMALLQQQGVAVHEVRVAPQPLTPWRLHQEAPDEISQQLSQRLFALFQRKGLLTAEGLLKEDPRLYPWQQLVASEVEGGEKLRLQADLSGLSEVLNLLWAQHEIVANATADMLNFFEAHTGSAAGSIGR